MIDHNSSTSDADSAEEPASGAASLLLECEAALAEGRPAAISPSSLSALSPGELGRFDRARHCLELLYGSRPARDSTLRESRAANPEHADTAQNVPPAGAPADAAKEKPAISKLAPVLINGARLGRFEVVRELGRGGQGVVFLARDPVLRREVALKLPRFEMLLTPEMRERFVREGRAAAALGHPNVLTIFEANEIGPICYLAQAFCAGPTLAAWLKLQYGTVAPRTAAAIVAELADGVEHAHQRGILHRDLKPSNVMLEPLEVPDPATAPILSHAHPPTGAIGSARLPFVPKLTDFGLAKVLEADGKQTTVGTVLGTAGYMSPEQAAGREEIGPESDVYGLGAILFEILNGRPPFVGAAPADTLVRVLRDEPQWPRSSTATAPRDLVAICRKCLEKNPCDRYSSARELAEDLRRYLAGKPTRARPATPLEQLVKWSKRRPAVAVLAAVSALSIVAVVVLSTWSAVRMARERDLTRVAQRRSDALLYASNMQLASGALDVGHADHARDFLELCVPESGREDFREFTWSYLQDALHAENATLRGHQGEVFALAFSADGQRLFSAGQDKIIRVWDVATHKQTDALKGHHNDVNHLDCSSDGRLLASVDDDGIVRIWDAETGSPLNSFAGSDRELFCATFSPKGDQLAIAGEAGDIGVWDVATWKRTHLLSHGPQVHTIVFSPDGQWLAASGKLETMHVWNLVDSQLVTEQKYNRPQGLVFSHDGNSLFFGEAHGDGVHRLRISADTLRLEQGWQLREPFSIKKLVLLDDANRMFALESDAGWSLWDATTTQCIHRFHGHRGRVYDLVVREQDHLVATAGEDGTVKLWDIAEKRNTSSVGFYTGIGTLALSPDGALLAGGAGGALRVWEANNGKLVFEDNSGPSHNIQVCFSSDGRRVAGSAEDGGLRIWTLDGSRGVQNIHAHDGAASTVAFHPDGRLLASGGIDQIVRLWDLDTGQQQAQWNTKVGVTKVYFPSDGKSLVFASGTMLERIDLASGRIEAKAENHTTSIGAVAFSRDERQIATIERGTLVQIWDAKSLTVNRTLTMPKMRSGHCAVAFHPNGYTLASVDTQSLSMWDLRTGRCLLTTSDPAYEYCDDLQFSPDGATLYISDGNYLHRLVAKMAEQVKDEVAP